jgi:hypothetical protein
MTWRLTIIPTLNHQQSHYYYLTGTDAGVITIFNPAPAPLGSNLALTSSDERVAQELWQESTAAIFENLRFCGPLWYVFIALFCSTESLLSFHVCDGCLCLSLIHPLLPVYIL